MTSREELEHVLSLLKTEQEEDRKQYQEKVLQSPLNERKQTGISWYPIIIRETYYTTGERLVLEIERPSNTDIPHQFTNGKVASLFSNYHREGKENPSIAGVVASAGLNNLRLTLFVDELPDWADQGKLGLDLLFDESSYREMESAMQRVIRSRNNRTEQLREILLGHKEPSFDEDTEDVYIAELNESQNRAVNNVLKAQDVAIIHGPPGTGKTTTLIHAIIETLKHEDQVLVCAPSNAAIDLITEKLFEKGVPVLRFGNPARISEELLMHTVDYKITHHQDYKRIKELKKRAVEFRNMALKYKRNFGREEREQRKMILAEARKIHAEALNIENYIVKDVIEKTKVFTATLVGSVNPFLGDREYGTVFIDEAAQALEPATWIPILRADKVVFAGDHCQLPPTVKSYEAAKAGLSVTLFEKCIERQKVDVMLQTQYRMNEQIMNFSGRIFYKGELKADDTVKDRRLGEKEPALADPVEFIDTAGCGYEEEFEREGESLFNREEANLLLKHLLQLYSVMKNSGTDPMKFRTAVISPYKAQVNLLKTMISENTEITPFVKNIRVNTVDGFQGQERDIVYISMVRSNDKGEIGFLNDIRRMNVAVTRPKRKLVLIGDSATIGQHSFYKKFLEYIEEIKAYRSAWELI
jgi:superfamily I DNA and/or RNA helicase